jgi:anti-sigma-K factor RskA
MKHLSPDIAEQYVIGALDAESVRFVEGHVAQCAECAKLLQQEARVELALHDVGAMGSVVSLASRRRRVGAVIVSAVAAIAAAVVLLVVTDSDTPPADTQPVLRKCADPSTASQCIEQAQFDGVITIGPRGEPIVPRYDVGGGR